LTLSLPLLTILPGSGETGVTDIQNGGPDRVEPRSPVGAVDFYASSNGSPQECDDVRFPIHTQFHALTLWGVRLFDVQETPEVAMANPLIRREITACRYAEDYFYPICPIPASSDQSKAQGFARSLPMLI
jgi:hypothetical protein